eukprot:Opistho-2@4468
MLIYLEGTSFPGKTLVFACAPFQTVARAKAKILHILYELGRANFQFRLKFKGVFLKDGHVLEEYGITERSVVEVVPTDSATSSSEGLNPFRVTRAGESDVMDALRNEIDAFDRREIMLETLRTMAWLHCIVGALLFATTWWYSGIYTLSGGLLGLYGIPRFTRAGGFVGRISEARRRFVFAYGVVASGLLLSSAVMGGISIVNIGKGCTSGSGCDSRVYYSATMYIALALILSVGAVLSFVLFWNMSLEAGDLIEPVLIKPQNVRKLIDHARNGTSDIRRNAALELSNHAASADTHKMEIAQNGGIPVLVGLAMCKDEATQEYACECFAELASVPSLQADLIAENALQPILALVHSGNDDLSRRAAAAFCSLVNADACKKHIVDAGGLAELGHLAEQRDRYLCRSGAGGLLDLACHGECRKTMIHESQVIRALTALVLDPRNDPEILRIALQALELLVMEKPSIIAEEAEDPRRFVRTLLSIVASVDPTDASIAGKVLASVSEDDQGCELLVGSPNLVKSLGKMARSIDAATQSLCARTAAAISGSTRLRERVVALEGFRTLLSFLVATSRDRDTKSKASTAIALLRSTSN